MKVPKISKGSPSPWVGLASLVKLALRYLTGLNIGGRKAVEWELLSDEIMVRCCEGIEVGRLELGYAV
jgi:hypothetical protein